MTNNREYTTCLMYDNDLVPLSTSASVLQDTKLNLLN